MSKISEITADGLAAAAAVLAAKSKYLEDHRDLTDAFWHFFSILENEQRGKMHLERRVLEGDRLWIEQQSALDNLPFRVYGALRRASLKGELWKPLDQMTDEELLSIEGIGKLSLAQIREACR